MFRFLFFHQGDNVIIYMSHKIVIIKSFLTNISIYSPTVKSERTQA